MKVKILSVLFAASLAPSLALGQGLPAKSLGPELRTQTIVIPRQGIADTAAIQQAGCSSGGLPTTTCVGWKGAVASKLFDGSTSYVVSGANIAQIAIPSKLKILLQDVNNDDTLACTSAAVVGHDQFGLAISETVSTINETGVNTVKVYGKLDKVTLSGCNGDSFDRVLVRATNYIGLPLKLASESGVISICRQVFTSGTITQQHCMKPAAADSVLEFDASGSSSRVDVANNSLNLETAFTLPSGGSTTTATTTINTGYVIRIRVPNGAIY